MPFEHVLPREIILHINWLTVGACRETENRYSKYVQNDANTVNTITTALTCVCVCVCLSGGKTFIFPGTRVSPLLSYVQISVLDNIVRKAHFERDNSDLYMNAFFYMSDSICTS